MRPFAVAQLVTLGILLSASPVWAQRYPYAAAPYAQSGPYGYGYGYGYNAFGPYGCWTDEGYGRRLPCDGPGLN